MAFLWSLVVVDPLIILSTILCGCVSIVVSLFDARGNATLGVARFWARSLLLFAGVRGKVEGLEKIDRKGHYVFCGNHVSYMDTPVALKSSVPGASRIELQFAPDLPHGAADLEALPAVKSVRALGSATYRISSDRGPASAQELIELARSLQLELKSLSVQSTSLDDVFLHYTGHGLAEAAEAAVPVGRGKKGGPQ